MGHLIRAGGIAVVSLEHDHLFRRHGGDGVPQVAWLHPWLIVHEWMSFGDLLRDPVSLDGAGRGLWVALGYAVVFLAAAWARLSGKDITS